jgi:hypothetical protein
MVTSLVFGGSVLGFVLGFVLRGLVFRGLVFWGLVFWGIVFWSGIRRTFVIGIGRFVLGVLGISVVFHIGDVSVVVGLVGDDLSAAIGQEGVVRAGHGTIAIAGLVLAKVVVSVVVLYGPVKVVRCWDLFKIELKIINEY